MAEDTHSRQSFLNWMGSSLSLAALSSSAEGSPVAAIPAAAPVNTGLRVVRDFLHRSDCDIYYEVTGSGPVLLFAHGISGNHLSWWQQVPYFCDRYTCITFSHRGFAPSKEASGGPGPAAFVDDLAALIAHLRLSDVSLVAQSMGGWSCLGYALREPKQVRALVLASTTGPVDFNLAKHSEIERLPLWRDGAGKARTGLTKQGIHTAAGARMAREQPALHFLYREIEDLSLGQNGAAVLEKLLALRNVSPEAVSRLHMPVLFITGEEDVVFPPGAAVALASLVPGAKLERVSEAGHSVYFERAEAFNRLVDKFLASAITSQDRKA